VKQLLHFTADWCQPCKKIKPIIESYILENLDIKYTQINVDENPAITTEYKVRSVPTLIVLIDGEITNRHSGVITVVELDKLINNTPL
jgi:thioredoxin 1